MPYAKMLLMEIHSESFGHKDGYEKQSTQGGSLRPL